MSVAGSVGGARHHDDPVRHSGGMAQALHGCQRRDRAGRAFLSRSAAGGNGADIGRLLCASDPRMSDARTLARLEAVETRLMLRDLVSRYAYSVDKRAIDTLADLFAEDAVFRARNGGFSARGRTAIAAELRLQLDGQCPSFHLFHAQFVHIDPPTP